MFEKFKWNKGWQYLFFKGMSCVQLLFTMLLLPYNVCFCPLLLGFWYYTMRQTNLHNVSLCRYLCHVLMSLFIATCVTQNNKKQDFDDLSSTLACTDVPAVIAV